MNEYCGRTVSHPSSRCAWLVYLGQGWQRERKTTRSTRGSSRGETADPERQRMMSAYVWSVCQAYWSSQQSAIIRQLAHVPTLPAAANTG
jgi:hypothetical protein